MMTIEYYEMCSLAVADTFTGTSIYFTVKHYRGERGKLQWEA